MLIRALNTGPREPNKWANKIKKCSTGNVVIVKSVEQLKLNQRVVPNSRDNDSREGLAKLNLVQREY